MKIGASIILLFAVIQFARCSNFTQTEALPLFEHAGISISNICAETQGKDCVSLDGMRDDTVSGLVDMKEKSNCSVVVTGGTEPGHYSQGTYTHENGYRINIQNDDCVYKYITSHTTCKIFDSPTGDVELVACQDEQNNNYALLKNEWDIGYFPKDTTFLSVLSRLLPDWKSKDMGKSR